MSAWCPPHGPNLVQLATFTGVILFLVYLNLALFQKRDFKASYSDTQNIPYKIKEKARAVGQ